ncbi:MAG: GNAT family N-acetyltransferase [Pricia sp.]
MLHTEVKSFEELTTRELYELLRLRSEVFVVEQDCVYQDIDAKDANALHLMGTKNGELIAYARIFKPGDYFEEAAIGRVAVKKDQRKVGYGKEIMKDALQAIDTRFNENAVRVSAQLYLERFYHELGFEQVGDGYLEDGIPHIAMVRNK